MGTATIAPQTADERTTASGGRRKPALAGFGFLAPFLLLYVLFLVGPSIYGLVMSFFHTSLVKGGLSSFAGFANYAEAFQTPEFWESLWHTVWFTILTTPPLVILALAFALLADRVVRGRWFFRLVFFAPYVLPSAVIALIWSWIYTPDIGSLSGWLTTVAGWFGVEFAPPIWLGDPNWAMISVAAATVWWTIGFNFVLYLAGLQDIPRELYESASIDGASAWQQMTRITVPLLGRTTTLVAVLQIIASLKIFDQIYLMTAGGPDFSTRPAIQYIYDVGFTDYRVGYASAVSMVLFALILVVSLVWFTIMRRQEREV
ncbi:sugar ABC transporter permease [Actinopolymorpha sp. B17G11]|uniref:carbohydrate ABC transporter permease n=1 Tax=unclassified Actinopolymorpha TaxID=2627063 RepID=UPI0032D8DAE5